MKFQMENDNYELPDGWEEVDFKRCIEIPHGPFVKIPQKKYLPKGKYPIIDQGSEFIAGYTDNKNDVCKGQLPVIIFGDHTRIFKFVDFAFAIGADGTKILRAKEGVDPKYLYYYLKSIELPSRGYSRHYRYLRENKILLAPENEQKRIVKKIELLLKRLAKTKQNLAIILPLLKKFRHSVLAKAFSGELTEEWRAKQKDLEPALRLLERIREGRKKLFGKKYKEPEPIDTSDLPELPEGWEWAKLDEICFFEYGEGLPENKRVKGKIPVYGSNGIVGYHNKYYIRGPAIIVGRKGSFGKVNMSETDCWPIDTTYYITKDSIQVDFEFLYFLLINLRLDEFDRSSAIPGLNREEAHSKVISLPSLTEQNFIVKKIKDFYTQADAIEKSVKIAQAHCEKLNQSILAKAFRGELVEQ